MSVPFDFNPAASDTRATGHYEVQGTALHIWTEGNTSTDKVAEYVDTSEPLAAVGEPTLSYSTNSGTIPPGFQLIVDFDGNGSTDGILVGEPTAYGNDWWASNGSKPFVKAWRAGHWRRVGLVVARNARPVAGELPERRGATVRLLAGLGRLG